MSVPLTQALGPMEIAQKSWPERYEVIFSSATKETSRYTVCTWQSEEKAIALASYVHGSNAGFPIYSVLVNSLGRAIQSGSGVLAPDFEDLIDRMEW